MVKEVYEAPKAEITAFVMEEEIAASSKSDLFGLLGDDEMWGD